MIQLNMAAFDWSSFFMGVFTGTGVLFIIAGLTGVKKKSG